MYAISDKAKDVRDLVMRLNSERGEREEAAAGLAAEEPAAVFETAQRGPPTAQLGSRPGLWQDFLDEQVCF